MNILEAYCKLVLHDGCALISTKHNWDSCPAQYVYFRIAKKHQKALQSNKFTIGYHINAKQLLSDLHMIKDQKGDYLAIIDMLIEEFEPYVEN